MRVLGFWGLLGFRVLGRSGFRALGFLGFGLLRQKVGSGSGLRLHDALRTSAVLRPGEQRGGGGGLVGGGGVFRV